MWLDKLLLIPRLAWYGLKAPKSQAVAWQNYWKSVETTGDGGDVLWDSESLSEMNMSLAFMQNHMDMSLPIVDIGCGNGRRTRILAKHFPRIIGVDISPEAIRIARTATEDDNVRYAAIDVARQEHGRTLARTSGPANVYMRGVLHTQSPETRARIVATIKLLLGDKGTLYLIETNHDGKPLDALVKMGARLTAIPKPLRLAMASGVRPPEAFGEAQYQEAFPSSDFVTLAFGDTALDVVISPSPRLFNNARPQVPGFFAVARRR